MELKTFRTKVTLLNETERNRLREKYINTFIDQNHKRYQDQIVLRKRCIDGNCYDGYLWDYLKSREIIDTLYVQEAANRIADVYVFWDIHSCEKILVKDYWKFEKDAMLKLNFTLLLQGKEYLPEDIYIFNESFTWTIILTHEDLDGRPYYLKSGMVP